MKASLAAANYSLFPATNTIHTLRWLTVDTSTIPQVQPSLVVLVLHVGKLISEPIPTACNPTLMP